jgi:hypothetical protein
MYSKVEPDSTENTITHNPITFKHQVINELFVECWKFARGFSIN